MSARGRGAVTALLCAVLLAGCAANPAPTEPTPTSSLTVSVPAASAAEFPPATRAAFQKALDSTRGRLNVPGAVAGVWSASASWTGSSGAADQSTGRAASVSDHGRIGSITKTFTIMSLLQQVDRGLVRLDDTIGSYIPGLPNPDATLGMLASMTSGIPDYSEDPEFVRDWTSDQTRTFTPEQLVGYVAPDAPLFPAGTQYRYSNTNAVLLGMVIEKVTGRPFADVLQADTLGPLGLDGTSFPGDSASIAPPALHGVTLQGQPEGVEKDATGWNPSYAFTAGAVVSTVDDLRVWGQVLGTGGGLISPALQQQRVASLARAREADPNADFTYGLGFALLNGWWAHNGSLPGYSAWLGYDPATGTVVAVLVNSDIGEADSSPADVVADALVESLEDMQGTS